MEPKGVIYMITNTINGKRYIGQSTCAIGDRLAQHKSSARHYARHLADPGKYAYKGTCTYLYRAMHLHGYESFHIELIVECAESQLDELEVHYIAHHGTMVPDGYNLTTGGGHFHHCEETKKRISDAVRQTMVSNIDNYRTSPRTAGMPAYVSYVLREAYEAYYINNHPLCKRKYFSVSTYGSIDSARAACVDFVKELEARGEPHVQRGPGGAPIKGLRSLKYGYQVRKTINGKVTEKSFNEPTFTREQHLQRALEFIHSLKKRPETERKSGPTNGS